MQWAGELRMIPDIEDNEYIELGQLDIFDDCIVDSPTSARKFSMRSAA